MGEMSCALRGGLPCFIAAAALFFSSGQVFAANSVHFVKSLSGPSGKIVDNTFVFDQTRNRFVYPQDKVVNVYFEWEAPPREYTLTAYWKDPDGQVASISPDIRMLTRTTALHAVWIFEITPTMKSGIWTVEIRIDGAPSGSHSFELVVPEPPKPPAQPKYPSLEEIYTATERSLVWVRKLDQAGRETDMMSGFVIGKDQVATAFEAIDGAAQLEIEFAGGRKVTTRQIQSCGRMQDYAVVKVDTLDVPALRVAPDAPVAVGERQIVFNVETAPARAFGGVDVAGRRTVPGFGERIVLSPAPTRESIGGPLLNLSGDVVGILGGSVIPGARFFRPGAARSISVYRDEDVAAVPIRVLTARRSTESITLADLAARDVLSAPVAPMVDLIWAVATTPTKDPSPVSKGEFSRHDPAIQIHTLWQKRGGQESKGAVSVRVYNAQNQKLADAPVKTITLSDTPTRVMFTFPVQPFSPSTYRVDVLWNDRAVWRLFFRVMD